MKQTDQEKGFAHLGIILTIIAVIAAIGFGGWWVWENNKDENKKQSSSNSQSQSESNDSSEDGNNTKEKEYSDAQYSFIYPATWAVDPSEIGKIILKSDDYEEARLVEAQSPYHVTSQGNKLTVSEIPSMASNETLEELTAHLESEEAELDGGSHKRITVGGHQALWVNNKHEDTYLYVVVFHDGKRTHIQLNAKDDTDPGVIKLFDDILTSFKFK